MAGKRKILVVEVGQERHGSILYATSVNPSLKPQKLSEVSYQGQKNTYIFLGMSPGAFLSITASKKAMDPTHG